MQLKNARWALVGIGAAAMVALLAAGMKAASPAPAYVRFKVSDKAVVYAEFKDAELRLATSVEGLKDAKPIIAGRLNPQTPAQFPEVAFPVPAEMLPTNCVDVKAKLALTGGHGVRATVLVRLTFSFKDDKGAKWTYVVMPSDVAPAPDASKSPVILVPASGTASLEVTPKPDGNLLGIGIRAKVGNTELSSIKKDGAEVNVQIRVHDETGKEVASKDGPLNSVGFA